MTEPTFREELRGWWRELDPLPALALILGTLLLIVYEYQGGTGFFHRVLASYFEHSEYSVLYAHLYWYTAAFVLLGVIPLLLLLLLAPGELHRFGLALGRIREGLGFTGLALSAMLPVVFVAATFQSFQDKYPLCWAATNSWTHLALYEVAYFLYYIGWEFFFRGFMLFSLERRLGPVYAVLVQMMPFALLHIGKPEMETIGSILAGIALGVLALRTRSVLYCVLLHGLVAWAMDFAVLTLAGRWPG